MNYICKCKKEGPNIESWRTSHVRLDLGDSKDLLHFVFCLKSNHESTRVLYHEYHLFLAWPSGCLHSVKGF